jgi:isocitrate lyase
MASNRGSSNGNSAHKQNDWETNPRWKGITRPYSQADVEKLRGSVHVEHTLAKLGAERLWKLLQEEQFVRALGATTGNQAVQQVKAGLKAIYVSGWQVAADANNAGQMYPDQSLYPADSVPNLVRRINQALMRADQVHHAEGKDDTYWFAPMVADAEAGFGGNLNAFELMKGMIEAGAACVHFEDQLSSAKKCGHLAGKVLVPTVEAIHKLVAARLAADVMGVPTLILARTDADSATLLTSDIDPRDREFITGERTHLRRREIGNCARASLRALCGFDLVRNFEAGFGGSAGICRGHSRQIPRENARLQLLTVIQLEEKFGRRYDCAFSGRAGIYGIQIPIHHAGRISRAEFDHVRSGAHLQTEWDDGLLRAAGKRIRIGTSP